MSDFVGASHHRLLGGSAPFHISEPLHVWSQEWRQLARRAVSLVYNEPFAQAMLTAKLNGTHGPEGLRFRSRYQDDANPNTSDRERGVRREIEDSLRRASMGTTLDAAGQMTRREMDRALDWMATVKGDGFAIRRWMPGRDLSHATAWRLIQPERVSNPDGRPNDDDLYEGLELRDGRIVAIHVEEGNMQPFGVLSERSWVRIPWVAPDGTPNVVHRVGYRVPGMRRGVSMYAPMLLLMKQLAGTIEAHVAGKRANACHPMIVQTDDAAELAKAERSGALIGPNTPIGPLSILYTRSDNNVIFPEMKWNGGDLTEFLNVHWKLLASTWGFPVEVVLAQMGEASLSSARAGLDQFNRTVHGMQNEHIEQVSHKMDESVVREDVARGRINAQGDDITRIMAGEYRRPPKYTTDVLKEAQAIQAEIEAGRSPTSAFDDRGWDFEAETEQARMDRDFLGSQSMGLEPGQEGAGDEGRGVASSAEGGQP